MIILSNKRYDALIDKIFDLRKENQDYSKVVMSVGGDYLDNKWAIQKLEDKNRELEQTVLTQSKVMRDLDNARRVAVDKYHKVCDSLDRAYRELDKAEARYQALLNSIPNRDEYEVQEDGSVVRKADAQLT